MKKYIKKTAFVILCALFLLALCSCSVKAELVQTTLNIKSADDFSGTRVMSFTLSENDEVTSQVTDLFNQKCPDCLKMEQSTDNGVTTYTFTLEFDSFASYKQEIAGLIGRTPRITFEPPEEDIFTSGFVLTEDFDTADLFKWAIDAAAEKEVEVKISSDDAVTTVKLGGSSVTTGSTVRVEKEFTAFDKVVITTDRYGENEYMRTFAFVMPTTSLDRIGKDRLYNEFFDPIVSRIPDELIESAQFVSAADSDKTSFVIVSGKCTLDQLRMLTDSVMPGSTAEYSQNNRQPFAESGTLSETFNFSGIVCNKNRTANVELIYNAMDSTTFDGDKNNITVTKSNVGEMASEIVSNSLYSIESIEVNLDISLTDKVTSGIIITYEDAAASKSASELAKSYFDTEYPELDTELQLIPTGNYDVSEAYRLVISASGSVEDVNEKMQAAFGEGNIIAIKGSGRFRLYSRNDVTHSVDLSSLNALAHYSGPIDYSFNAANSQVKNAELSAAGNTQYNLLLDKTLKNSFVQSDISAPVFSISYQYQRISIPYLLVALIITVLLLAGIALLIRLITRKVYKKRTSKKEEAAIEAVRSVALANLPPEQRGDLKELPPELAMRPAVVLEPRGDDGLDEDGDEPEGVWLFQTALKLFTLLCGVLFFFNFLTVSKSGYLFSDPESLSGLDLVTGATLFDAQLPAWPLAACLILVPVVILVLLSIRSSLPKLIVPGTILGLSLFQIFFLLNLPSHIEEQLDLLKATITDYVTDPQFVTGYTYSMVIYILLALGALVLLISEVAALIKINSRLSGKQ